MKDIEEILRALADPTRLALYERIKKAGETTVSELLTPGGVSQPAVSQHLRRLRDAGLVIERRDGRLAFYRTLPEGLAPLRAWLDARGAAPASKARSKPKPKR